MFTFVGLHLSNHALGLIGLDAMEAGRGLFLLLWRNPVGTTLLYGAAAVHLSLNLYAIFSRRNWRQITLGEALQMLLGLSVPPLVIVHAIANRGGHEVFGLNDTYAYVVLSLWRFEPAEGLKQAVLTVVAWFHGCMGVHYWLRLKPWYGGWRMTFYSFALLLPALALTGFAAGGREASALFDDPIWRQRFIASINNPGEPGLIWVRQTVQLAYGIMSALAFGLLIAIALRRLWERRRGVVVIGYPNKQRVRVNRGTTVLDASRAGGIPHASVCGGRGRCSTCRVRVGAGADLLAPPSEDEVRVLSRVGAPDSVRLACQIRPVSDLDVVPLLPPSATARDAFQKPSYVAGSEREICILFADLRGFTKFAEQKLPYDVVFVINQYFRAMGQAVERAGGQIDKFIGDGVMALFGLHGDSSAASRAGLRAAREMALALEALNESLRHDLREPLRIGIGLHVGTVIVGEMGYARAVSVTAIGDAVNTASRLETLTKEYGVQLVVSRRVAKRAGVNLKQFPRQEIEIRGRTAPMPVYLVGSALDLYGPLEAEATATAQPSA